MNRLQRLFVYVFLLIFQISKSRLSEIIRNQVYIGKVLLKSDTNPAGEYVQGLHKPIISMDLFNQVQTILSGKNLRKGKPSFKAIREELYLRGHLECPNCNGPLTGSASKSRSGGRHYYYHCNHCHSYRIRADKTHILINDPFSEFVFSTPVKKLYNLLLDKLVRERVKVKARSEEQIDKEITSNNARIQNLEDQFSDGNIDSKTFNELRYKYSQKINQLEREKTSGESTTEQAKLLKSGLNLVENFPKVFAKADVLKKKRLLSSTFPEKIQISENKCRTEK